MSDFDKEAEREKLREKYEREEQDREATERMSDLLLKGATMTNAHCGTCGDPIFRYEGREFCPTCQEPVGSEAEQSEASDGASGEAASRDAERSEVEQETGDETEGVEPTPDAGAEGQPETTPGSNGRGRKTNREPATGADADATTVTSRTNDDAAPHTESGPTQTPGGVGADEPETPETAPRATDIPDSAALTDTRASLTRTLSRLAAQAESSEDLERTRAYLAAVEDAADALAAVNRADR